MNARRGMKRPAPRFTMEDGFPYFVCGVDCEECRGAEGVQCDACSSTGWQIRETYGLNAYHDAITAGVMTKADRPEWVKWRKAHLCARCQRRVPTFQTRLCGECREAYRALKQDRKAKGSCVRCGAVSVGATVCSTCKEKQRGGPRP